LAEPHTLRATLHAKQLSNICLMKYRVKSTLWLVSILVALVIAIFLHGEIHLRDAVLLFAICFACELVDSGLGMGYGTILTPTLLLMGYEPQDIVPTILLSELLSGFSASYFHNEIKNVELGLKGKDLSSAAILAGGSLAGVLVGVMIAVNVSKDVLNPLIGCIILTSGFFVILLSNKVISYRRWKMILLSAIASFNKAISGGGYGPLVTSGQILSGVQSKASVGITSFAEAFTCLVAVTLFLIKGGWINFVIFVPMVAGALSSVPFAVFAINKAREDQLKIFIGILTMCMGALTIVKALT